MRCMRESGGEGEKRAEGDGALGCSTRERSGSGEGMKGEAAVDGDERELRIEW